MTKTENIDHTLLRFDPDNPRLPEHLKGASSEKLAEYYFEHSVITDLVKSMAENGFFPHEPMIVVPNGDGTFWVAEGNRRLTALSIIHGRELAADLPRPDVEFSPERIESLCEVPCVVSTDMDAIRKFIGFRHISGPLTWEPEAKARFLVDQVDRAIKESRERPFLYVANSVGSNVQTVRGSYASMKLLRVSRDEMGEDISQIQNSRFGVWLRLMSSPEFRKYIGFDPIGTLEEIHAALQNLKADRLTEVLGDLRSSGGGPPVLRDSRDATNYGRVLMSAPARENLRKTGDLAASITIIDRESLPDRLLGETRRIDALTLEVKSSDYDQSVELASERLARAAANLWKLSKSDDLGDLFNR